MPLHPGLSLITARVATTEVVPMHCQYQIVMFTKTFHEKTRQENRSVESGGSGEPSIVGTSARDHCSLASLDNPVPPTCTSPLVFSLSSLVFLSYCGRVQVHGDHRDLHACDTCSYCLSIAPVHGSKSCSHASTHLVEHLGTHQQRRQCFARRSVCETRTRYLTQLPRKRSNPPPSWSNLLRRKPKCS